jgi:cell fate (sporulation/competence/biofilm development) regulator YmcA (YheA/YmcA/DUF963 family)
MNREEYIDLFHRAEVNLVAFKQVNDCDEELRKMVEMAVEAEREACAEICKKHADFYAGLEPSPIAQSAWAACIDNRDTILARGQA